MKRQLDILKVEVEHVWNRSNAIKASQSLEDELIQPTAVPKNDISSV